MQPFSAPCPAPMQFPISLLEKTPGILELLLRDLPVEVLDWKPAADRWSIGEVLSHMNAIERLYEQRARRMVMEDSPSLAKFEGSAEEELQKKSARQHLEEFIALRRAFVFYLHGIPSVSAGRTGQHPELGRITLSQMLHEQANHDLGHLRQIAELYRAQAFYSYCGPFQKYSNPKP